MNEKASQSDHHTVSLSSSFNERLGSGGASDIFQENPCL